MQYDINIGIVNKEDAMNWGDLGEVYTYAYCSCGIFWYNPILMEMKNIVKVIQYIYGWN